MRVGVLVDRRQAERNQIEKIPDEFAFLRKLRRLRMTGRKYTHSSVGCV